MKKWICKVTFMKSENLPDFCPSLEAENSVLANSEAHKLARECGYDGVIKFVTVREEKS